MRLIIHLPTVGFPYLIKIPFTLFVYINIRDDQKEESQISLELTTDLLRLHRQSGPHLPLLLFCPVALTNLHPREK